jgi:hypothetical protein
MISARSLSWTSANAIATVHLRAEMLSEPFRGKILGELRQYLAYRTDFAKEDLDEPALRASLVRSNQILRDMQQQAVALVEQSPNSVTPIFVQALHELGDWTEKRLAAEENRIPAAMWLMLVLIAVLACVVMGYGMRRRQLLGMLVLPLTVAVVMALVSGIGQPAHWTHPGRPAKFGTPATRNQFFKPAIKVAFHAGCAVMAAGHAVPDHLARASPHFRFLLMNPIVAGDRPLGTPISRLASSQARTTPTLLPDVGVATNPKRLRAFSRQPLGRSRAKSARAIILIC